MVKAPLGSHCHQASCLPAVLSVSWRGGRVKMSWVGSPDGRGTIINLADGAGLEEGPRPCVAVDARPLGCRLGIGLAGPPGAGGLLEEGVDELDPVGRGRMPDGSAPVGAAGGRIRRPGSYPAVAGPPDVVLLLKPELLVWVGFLAGRDGIELDFALGYLFPLEGGLDGEGELFRVCLAVSITISI